MRAEGNADPALCDDELRDLQILKGIDLTVPFGGVKQSGFGSDKSLHAMDKFTDLKTTWIELS